MSNKRACVRVAGAVRAARAHRRAQFPITSLREIKLLKRLRHDNIVHLHDVVVGRKREE